MQNKLYKKHKDCEMMVNYIRCNAHGRPSMCCAVHKDKLGRPQWIDWLSREKEDYLIEGMCVTVIGENLNPVGNALNLREFMRKHGL
jgi:hypothetical protein